MHLLLITLSALTSVCALSQYRPHRTLFKWKVMEFDFPTEQAKKDAEAAGNLKPTNAMLFDIQPYYDPFSERVLRTFVTIPRLKAGIPYSLATVSHKRRANGPLLEPYPNYEAHNINGTNCDAITSAFHVAITECHQMWVIDSGSVDSNALCPPQLLLFDLNTDELIHRYRFPISLYNPGSSLFITPVVNVKDPFPSGNCSRTMVYVADVEWDGIVVYDFMQDIAWRVENKFMNPDPKYSIHTVAGQSFFLLDGIFGMATDKEKLYFHPLSSATEYSVDLAVIDNSTLFANNTENMPFRPLGERGSECTVSAIDSKNNMYCVTLNPIALIRWNVETPYNRRNFKALSIAITKLEFVSGMKVVRNYNGHEELWMASNRYQKMATGTQNFYEDNFRIVVLNLEKTVFINTDICYLF